MSTQALLMEQLDPPSIVELTVESSYTLPREFVSFYVSDEPGKTGWPQNGTLFEDSEFSGEGPCSFFDPVLERSKRGLLIIPLDDRKAAWKLTRCADVLTLTLGVGSWKMSAYEGNEPNWTFHPFPFRNLPDESRERHHARIRGLLDFCAGTRTADAGFHYQSPNSVIGKGYLGDGIPDTFFHFISVFDHLSEKRQKWFLHQFEWLGEHIRFDGCIPWGGCIHGIPYYNVWKRPDCGLFFDGNGLWLMVMDKVAKSGYKPDLATVIRAADFYLHYLSTDGLLVAAQSTMRGCEWADLIQSGWKCGLINIIACKGLQAASDIIRRAGEEELAMRYTSASKRIKDAINRTVEDGGLWLGNGFADWVGKDGKPMKSWRIDANMLSIVWDVATPEHARIIYDYFKQAIKAFNPPVPFPYLLSEVTWLVPEDKMLEGCREFGCGTDAMPGRMGAPTIAAARKMDDNAFAEEILTRLTNLIIRNEFIWEKYSLDGHGYGTRSYIEHATSTMLADAIGVI